MIDKLFRATLDHPKGVLAAALLLCVACALCIPLVKINYQFSDYLPEDSPSTGSLQTLEDAFGANLPNSGAFLLTECDFHGILGISQRKAALRGHCAEEKRKRTE